MFWMAAVWKKESRFESGLRRRSFEENLEFYPVTRRAFNKAKSGMYSHERIKPRGDHPVEGRTGAEEKEACFASKMKILK